MGRFTGYKSENLEINIPGKLIKNFEHQFFALANKKRVDKFGELEIKIENEAQRQALIKIFPEIDENLLKKALKIDMNIIEGKIISFALTFNAKTIKEEDINVTETYKYIKKTDENVILEKRKMYKAGTTQKLKCIDGLYKTVEREICFDED